VTDIEDQTRRIALELGVVGLMNVQFAVPPDGRPRVLEVNPRASRTVPFVSKATGVPLARIAAKVMVGKTLDELGVYERPSKPRHVSIKESVFPFAKLPPTDSLLGPEMKSTGEVMGIASTLDAAFEKTLLSTGCAIPRRGRAFFAVRPQEVLRARAVAKRLVELGFDLEAPRATVTLLGAGGVLARVVDGERFEDGLSLVVTTSGRADPSGVACVRARRAAVARNVPYFTTMAACELAVASLERAASDATLEVRALQELYAR
jgi:carbamoyl-phosphate synthase large subunit